ncbi:hypothetical protein KC19_11G151100 [Ceratodon purpureus]|uniref:Uncharacterized protein n=1 Tax=Ceratodon purpureus TaxID=3225 RepID=A0A8T0GGN5_CERPU|nr:hypothetical protein KC19_11G151100 [Ceratodon purpureus]
MLSSCNGRRSWKDREAPGMRTTYKMSLMPSCFYVPYFPLLFLVSSIAPQVAPDSGGCTCRLARKVAVIPLIRIHTHTNRMILITIARCTIEGCNYHIQLNSLLFFTETEGSRCSVSFIEKK